MTDGAVPEVTVHMSTAHFATDAEKRQALIRDADKIPGPGPMKAKIVHRDPTFVVIDNFITKEEAAHLLALAEGRWVRSTVTRGSAKVLHGTYGSSPSSERSSALTDTNGDTDAAARHEAAETDAAAATSDETCAACSSGDAGSTPKPVDDTKKLEPVMDEFSRNNQPQEVFSDKCTSTTVRLDYGESDVVERVQARVAVLAQMPLDNVEQLVLVRYSPGEHFRTHHDGAVREKTVFVYFNDVDAGGATFFPNIGLQIIPTACMAVMWSNVLPHAEGEAAVADRRADHEAQPPGVQDENGNWTGPVKYGMNCFVNSKRQRDASYLSIRMVGGA
eukprot:gnl/TRDRNA2_/TRDRNA2_82357_c0_seq2.p1 gnl/TRDRNA2_/TRDRNA2_82357_c0~~gnl/TRDRNA2_/TRDRNA2_82357_c0_seq2.p1  ORF type:complete len:333 (-),score=67.66 gnl/TRDRNA2_/TRDRNA2_82357_c0_seq2:71-1069(-)